MKRVTPVEITYPSVWSGWPHRPRTDPEGTVAHYMDRNVLDHIAVFDAKGNEMTCFLQSVESPWLWHSRSDCPHLKGLIKTSFIVLPDTELCTGWRMPCKVCKMLEDSHPGAVSPDADDKPVCAIFPAGLELRLMDGVQNEDHAGRFRHSLRLKCKSDYLTRDPGSSFTLTFGKPSLPPCYLCFPFCK